MRVELVSANCYPLYQFTISPPPFIFCWLFVVFSWHSNFFDPLKIYTQAPLDYGNTHLIKCFVPLTDVSLFCYICCGCLHVICDNWE